MATGIRKSSSRKKSDIIETTTRLLLEKGSSASTSTTDICSAAHLTRPSLYHFFGSKQNLLLSVHLDHMEKTLKPYLHEAAAMSDPVERLSFMVKTFVKEIICKHPELRVLIHDSLTIKDDQFQEVQGVWKEHYTLLRDTIDEIGKAGTIKAGVKPSLAALFILGMLTWVLYWFDYERQSNIDEIADQALLLVKDSLGLGE